MEVYNVEYFIGKLVFIAEYRLFDIFCGNALRVDFTTTNTLDLKHGSSEIEIMNIFEF